MSQFSDAYFIGKEGFVWFVGIVEDRKDPEEVGRVRVRCFGWHTDNKELIPTDSLPWAHIVQPPNLPASYTCKEGDMVFGFFLDADSAQFPVVVGVIPGKPASKPDKSKGFSDPNGKYPKRLGESTFSRLARGNKYPYNYVHETESGHTFELDDNGKGRIKLSHNNGTYVEFDTDGNQINVVKKDNTVKITADNTVTIGGDCKISVSGDMTLSVSGTLNIKAGDINMVSDGAINTKGTSVGMDATAAINISSGAATKLKAGAVLSMDGAMTTLSGGVVDVAGGLVNVQMGSAALPDMLDIPDFETDILASIDGIPGVESGGNFLDKLKNGIDKVGKVVQKVKDVAEIYAAVQSGNILGAIGGLSQLNSSLGKALGPVTETINKVNSVVSKVENAVGDVLTVVNSVETIAGKELFPRTDFLENTLGQLDSFSEKLDRVNTPLGYLGESTYEFDETLGRIEEFSQSSAELKNSVDDVINLYNSAAKPNQKIATIAERQSGG